MAEFDVATAVWTLLACCGLWLVVITFGTVLFYRLVLPAVRESSEGE